MSKTRRKKYQVYEGLRCAMMLCFISGYVNAFTYMTQGKRFAGVQTGNLLSFGIYLSENKHDQALQFLLPILVFMLGQSFTYFMHRWANQKGLHWYLLSSFILTGIALLTALLTPFLSSFFTVSALAFFAAIQVDTFKTLRGASYANVMMTGNIKNAAYLLTKGFCEKNKEITHIGRNTLIVILAFACGVICSTLLSLAYGEYALAPMLLPLLYVNYLLAQEFYHIQSKIKPIKRRV
ncbi:YoaK family protein [Streptococcus castoreus]|uniref:YoaK family protein n=1 Tax=Streptococcus castoreus TaxID=254786 RepID=UPI0004024330|nr:YoaK family protein [Streptococcus castoreus]